MDGYLTFKWVWPELSGYKNYNIWRQSSNPMMSSETSFAANYTAIDINWDSGGEFAGLLDSGGYSGATRLNGDPSGCWWFALGSYQGFRDGIPGPSATYGDGTGACSATGYTHIQHQSNCGGSSVYKCLLTVTQVHTHTHTTRMCSLRSHLPTYTLIQTFPHASLRWSCMCWQQRLRQRLQHPRRRHAPRLYPPSRRIRW